MSKLKMKYFVLKPEGDDIYAKASRVAMHQYAQKLFGEDKEFASSILEWLGEIDEKYGKIGTHTKNVLNKILNKMDEMTRNSNFNTRWGELYYFIVRLKDE